MASLLVAGRLRAACGPRDPELAFPAEVAATAAGVLSGCANCSHKGWHSKPVAAGAGPAQEEEAMAAVGRDGAVTLDEPENPFSS